jgi:hypothetical protein
MSDYSIFPEIDDTIKECKKHLVNTGKIGTQIESYFTRFLLVFICSEYEKEIEKVVINRANATGDTCIASYVAKTFRYTKHVKLPDLRGQVLGRFSVELKDNFNTKFGREEEASYENIITNRDSSAHGGILNMTFLELEESIPKAEKIVIAFKEVMSR